LLIEDHGLHWRSTCGNQADMSNVDFRIRNSIFCFSLIINALYEFCYGKEMKIAIWHNRYNEVWKARSPLSPQRE
jgi:hypothetical protein